MRRVHNREKEQFEKLFRQENIDYINERAKVLDVFLQTEKHVTESELARLLEKAGYSSTPTFVRKTLDLMCDFGFAQRNRFDNGEIRYEHKHLGFHHDHIICIKCQKIIEFNDQKLENLQMKIAAANKFYILQHKMEIYGICSECLEKRPKLISLSSAKSGEHLTIKKINGGHHIAVRISTMGLRVGDNVEVITNQGRGQMVIAANTSRLVLGRGIAEKILAELCR